MLYLKLQNTSNFNVKIVYSPVHVGSIWTDPQHCITKDTSELTLLKLKHYN